MFYKWFKGIAFLQITNVVVYILKERSFICHFRQV